MVWEDRVILEVPMREGCQLESGEGRLVAIETALGEVGVVIRNALSEK